MICATCFFCLRQLRRVKTLVHEFITSCIDYCNTVLAGAPKYVTDKLQRVLCLMLEFVSSVIRRNLIAACHVCYILIFTGSTFRGECSLSFAWIRRCMQDKAPQYLKEYCISFSDKWQSTASSLSQPSPFCATSSSTGLHCCWSDDVELYLTIYVICYVAIVILDVS